MYATRNNIFERSGIGSYDKTGDWTWEYYPPPYDFLAPSDSVAMPPPILGGRGVGCASGGGCGCGGKCGGGVGHTHGVGLFDSMDFSSWGIGEWACILGAVYLGASLLGDTKRATKAVGKRRSKSRRKRQLREQLSSL